MAPHGRVVVGIDGVAVDGAEADQDTSHPFREFGQIVAGMTFASCGRGLGTLANMYGDRIDLGLGRAPGTDMMTARALPRSSSEPQAFADNIFDLQRWFGTDGTARSAPIVSAVSAGTEVPIWVLGSTVNGASIAGQLGLPFALASHFAPDQLDEAVNVYRDTFPVPFPPHTSLSLT